jgi:histone acetyltransferase
MNRLLSEMQNHASSWPFREPVKLSDAADYYDVIEQPMGAHFFSFHQKLRMIFFLAA